MKYVEMSIDEAVKYCKGKKVLVAIRDLENDEISSFAAKSSEECKLIIENSETVIRVCDDFINQLRAFSEKQKDIRNIRPVGMMSTFLIHDSDIIKRNEQKTEQMF